MKYAIWYLKPKCLASGMLGALAIDPKALDLTHTHLIDIEIEASADTLDAAYHHMQGEIWSSQVQSRKLIFAKNLNHASMVVGDVLVDEHDAVNAVAGAGFQQLC